MKTGPSDAEIALAGALRDRGLRVTPQRVAIARVVRDLDSHVTAEQVMHLVSERLPSVSLPTVYATLDLLEELGSVRRVNAHGGAVLYDGKLGDHHHAVCTSCGAVVDIEAPMEQRAAMAAARRAGFAPEYADTVIRGLCASCR